MTDSDEMITRYLFGELSDLEQTQLEQHYFADAQTFERLAEVETDLVDSYARGRLSPQMRERFERGYLVSPGRRARVRFGGALAAKVDQIAASRSVDESRLKNTSRWRLVSPLTGGRRVLAFSMAVALMLLAPVCAWLFIHNRRLQQDLARTRDAQTAEQQRERAAQLQLDSERTRTQELTAELERARAEAQPTPGASEIPTPAAGSAAIASLVLMPAGIRGVDTGTPPTLVIPPGTQQVRLQLKLKENEYQNYQAVLQSVGGQKIFNRRQVKPLVNKSGASFVFTLPASTFETGDYILSLKGSTRGGELDDVSQSLFRVEKN